jgi:hypothetical protein
MGGAICEKIGGEKAWLKKRKKIGTKRKKMKKIGKKMKKIGKKRGGE